MGRRAGAGGGRGPLARAVAATFRADLPRDVQTLQAGALLNALGNGLTLPFLLIYLHNVLGFGLGTSGLIVGTASGVSIVATPVFGWAVDRVGARVTFFASLALLAVGYSGYAVVDRPWQGFLTAVLAGLGNGGFWPSQSSLIAGLTEAHERPSAFAMQRVMMNLGVGLGAMLGGLIATTDRPATFQALFLLDGLTFVLYAVILRRVRAPARAARQREEPAGRYLDVLRHRVFMGVIGLNFLLILAGLALIEVFPAYAKNEAGVGERGIGVIFLVNTLLIVAVQLPLSRALRGYRRMAVVGGVALVWAVSWLLIPTVASMSPMVATILFAAVFALFGVGECLHGVVQAPLVTDLADERLIGRYMALSALSWSAALGAAPAIGGFVLERSPHALWYGSAAVLVLIAGAALVLERFLPVAERRTPAPAVA